MTDQPNRQYLSLSLGDERYAIAIGSVREVLGYSRATRLPRMASYLRGIIALRGRSVPVVDLRLRFGLPERPGAEDSAIIVVDMPGQGEESTVGIMADAVHEVLELGAEGLEPTPRFGVGPGAAYVSGIGRDDKGFILVLDIDLVLDEGARQPEAELAEGA